MNQRKNFRFVETKMIHEFSQRGNFTGITQYSLVVPVTKKHAKLSHSKCLEGGNPAKISVLIRSPYLPVRMRFNKDHFSKGS